MSPSSVIFFIALAFFLMVLAGMVYVEHEAKYWEDRLQHVDRKIRRLEYEKERLSGIKRRQETIIELDKRVKGVFEPAL